MDDHSNFWLTICIVFLLVLIVIWVRNKIRLRHARIWPVEAGRVDSTVVRLVKTGLNQSNWVAELKYSYTVQGVACSGLVRRSFLIKSRAEKWIGRYAGDVPLTIRYNPAKVQDSVFFEKEQAGAAVT
jgi:hypothetical protein